MRPADQPAEHPILFSTGLVRKIREGAKTETRRVVRPQPLPQAVRRMHPGVDLQCPYGASGDRLWVRTTWAVHERLDDVAPRDMNPDTEVFIRAAELHIGERRDWVGRWRPSIHMPRWASRDLLEITSVGVEELHDITPRAILAEGVGKRTDSDSTLMSKWIALWDSINGRRGGYSWADCPWVWVVQFRRVTTP